MSVKKPPELPANPISLRLARKEGETLTESLASLPLERRWRQQRQPVASALAIIRRKVGRNSQHLLIRRVKQPYAGKWGLIGGKWDFGESLAETIVREIKEET